MDTIISMTSEELGVLLSTAEFDDESRIMIHDFIKPKGERELVAIFNSTVNQLRMKGIWDEEKHKKELNPISEEIMTFLKVYSNYRYMIRATNEWKKATLVLRYVKEDTWLYQYIDDEIIHNFAYISEVEIPEVLKEFYAYSFIENEYDAIFYLSDKEFDLICNPKKQKKVEKSFTGTSLEKMSFEKFMVDLHTNYHARESICVLSYDEGGQLQLLNGAYFFYAPNGVWLTEYEHEKEVPVKIHLAHEETWDEILYGVRLFSSNLIKELAKEL
ncbi:hypothetical protein A374_04729 [Fictibacillus macauensis ZFHKF-1]|uniref:Uncharacterized protein n=1 Tax=Fictibacillus macauensis ZFHKF-1 TaxID=1196324 RepID=I8UIY4_9BACL|nr:hypothetical protein [Fictibacillus macauensis]EIT86850.1 hypothetical protein A374_04729 [Fictibacillus macauensis ZFHKF-1]